VEMGIGIHTGQVVLGNIGSPERMKYGVVGRHVNLTSRIQSYTTGGQIMISETTRQEAGPILRIGKQTEVKAKGIEHPVAVCEVLGIGRPYKLYLPETAETLLPLVDGIPVKYAIVDADQLNGETLNGRLMKLSAKGAEARLQHSVPAASNLEMHLVDARGEEIPGALCGKVVAEVPGSGTDVSVRFTSMTPEIRTFLRDRRR